MSLRPATPSDAASIAALSLEVWIGTYLKHGINGFFAEFALAEFTAAKTLALLADPKHYCVVSQNADGIDGILRLTRTSGGPVEGCDGYEIATLYVQQRHHGKGIGKRLLHAAFNQSRAEGVASVWLATNAQNAPAIAFYHAQGFALIGETDFRIGDARYPNNVYRYALEP